MRRFSSRLSVCGIVALSCTLTSVWGQSPPASPVDRVRPMIGTGGTGHTFPGATLPFGMVQLSPDTRNDTWEGCAGYRYSDPSILGFSHNHLSGTGVGDLGYFLLMPTVGELKLPRGKVSDGYKAPLSHEQEESRPGYYRVYLPDRKVTVELTATARAGMHRYTFPQTDQGHVVLDLRHGIGAAWRNPVQMQLKVENQQTISGFRQSRGWGGLMTFYFVAEFSRPWHSMGAQADGQPWTAQEASAREIDAKDLQAWFDFRCDLKTPDRQPVLVRLGLSTVDVEGARKNLHAEMPTWDFDALAAAARETWNQTLSQVEVESQDTAFLERFYTGLYHSSMAPNQLEDRDGRFRGVDGTVQQSRGGHYYTQLSLWDTFRAEHSLLALLQPQRVDDLVQTMLQHYETSPEKPRALPVWTNAGRENWCMGGNHAIPVITEAYLKGFRGFDAPKALAAMTASMEAPRRGQAEYRKFGYIPADRKADFPKRPLNGINASQTLELAYDDACIARLAAALGEKEIAARHEAYARNWKNLWDDRIGFIRPKCADGSWLEPFNPAQVTDDFQEGNAWQYSFSVIHDAPGLMAQLGGPEALVRKLDELFDPKRQTDLKDAPPDVSGLMGLYAHGNEPCHHLAYLYNLAQRPDKTQQRVRELCQTMYQNSPDQGLCGNDDCGQMSAWYVFSALGFYPADPSSGVYMLGSPLVDRATIRLARPFYGGGTFELIVTGNSAANKFIRSARLNGQPLEHPWFTHAQMVAGGKLELEMSPTPGGLGMDAGR